MSAWDKVGDFLKQNAAQGVGLVGAILTGNIPAAVAAGVTMVAQATGTTDPSEALAQLQGNPETMIKLKQLANERDAEINRHIEAQELMRLEDQQREHTETQTTIRAGDKADDKFIRWTRPGQSWLSLLAAIIYAFTSQAPNEYILMLLLTLPFTYAGLRQLGKWKDSDSMMKAAVRAK